MQKELEDLQPKLVTAQEENAQMMIVIEKENVEVEARSKIVRKDEEAANEKAAEAQALKDEVSLQDCNSTVVLLHTVSVVLLV